MVFFCFFFKRQERSVDIAFDNKKFILIITVSISIGNMLPKLITDKVGVLHIYIL